jgi:hypothetical protein
MLINLIDVNKLLINNEYKISLKVYKQIKLHLCKNVELSDSIKKENKEFIVITMLKNPKLLIPFQKIPHKTEIHILPIIFNTNLINNLISLGNLNNYKLSSQTSIAI